MTRFSTALRRRRRLVVALVAALALVPASAQAQPAKWSLPDASATWSVSSASDNGPALAEINRSSWT